MSDKFTVDTSDLQRAMRALETFRPGPTLEAAVDDTAEAVADAVRGRARRHHVTGKLERFVRVIPENDGEHRRDIVHASGRVAHLITGGTRRHRIRARRGRALELEAAGGSLLAFAASVDHPGTAADPFVAEGIADASNDITRTADLAAARLADNLASDIGG